MFNVVVVAVFFLAAEGRRECQRDRFKGVTIESDDTTSAVVHASKGYDDRPRTVRGMFATVFDNYVKMKSNLENYLVNSKKYLKRSIQLVLSLQTVRPAKSKVADVLKGAVHALFKRADTPYRLMTRISKEPAIELAKPRVTDVSPTGGKVGGVHLFNAVFDAFFAFGVLDIFGVVMLIQMMLQKNEDGIPVLDYSSVEGIMTAISLPSQFIGALMVPFFAAPTLANFYQLLAYKAGAFRVPFLPGLSALPKFWALRRIFGIRHIIAVLSKVYRTMLIIAKASEIVMRNLGPILALVDVVVSIYGMYQAMHYMQENVNPDIMEFYVFNVVNAASGTMMALTGLAIATYVFAVSFMQHTAAIVAAKGLAKLSAIGAALCAATGPLAPIAATLFVVFMVVVLIYMAITMPLAAYYENRSQCNNADRIFTQYSIKLVRELEYLVSPNKSSSDFNLFQLMPEDFIASHYVMLDELVIEEKAVRPKFSPRFLRQLQGGFGSPEVIIGKEFGVIGDKWDVERDVAIKTLFLPNNLYTDVATHSCKNTAAKSGHINMGYCDARFNHKEYYSHTGYDAATASYPRQTNARQYEWTQGSVRAIEENNCGPTGVDMGVVEFIMCQLECDRMVLSAGESCNAYLYDFPAQRCQLYRCGQRFVVELDHLLHGPQTSTQSVGAFFRQKSFNCGGYYAASCALCKSREMCHGECRWRETTGRCERRICGTCIFPFSYTSHHVTREFMGCTSWGSTLPFCAVKVDQNGLLTSSEYCHTFSVSGDDCRQVCADHSCEMSDHYVTADAEKLCGDGGCNDTFCLCKRKLIVDTSATAESQRCGTQHQRCVPFPYSVQSLDNVKYGCTTDNYDANLDTWPWCPTVVRPSGPDKGMYVRSSGKYIWCDPNQVACYPTCKTYKCKNSSFVTSRKLYSKICRDWKCDDRMCGCKSAKHRRRRLARYAHNAGRPSEFHMPSADSSPEPVKNTSKLYCCGAMEKNDIDLFQVPAGTSTFRLLDWINKGRAILVSDQDCMTSPVYAYNKIKTQSTRFVMAGTGYAKSRNLTVYVTKDTLMIQTLNVPISLSEMQGPTPDISYDIHLNGSAGEIVERDIMAYSLIVPELRFSTNLPPERTSSFSYHIYLPTDRPTSLQIEFPSYAAHDFVGYSWGGKNGIRENCVAPFAKPLEMIDKMWATSIRSISRDPERLITLFRRIRVASASAKRVDFFVKRGTHHCSVQHGAKTFMLDAILAQDPAQHSVWESRRRTYANSRTSLGAVPDFESIYERSAQLSRILTTLQEYRMQDTVNNFTRDERPVQVVLGNTTNITFYFNGKSGIRFWDIFVPQLADAEVNMDYTFLAANSSLFPSRKMSSVEVMSNALNVTYQFGDPTDRLSSIGLVTVHLFYTGAPQLVRVTCGDCDRDDVKKVIAQEKASSSDGLMQVLDIDKLVIINRDSSSQTPDLLIYTTSDMPSSQFFAYTREHIPLGYFENKVGFPNNCIIAASTKASKHGNCSAAMAELFFGTTSQASSTASTLVPVQIPEALDARRGHYFRGARKSDMPGCNGVEAVSEDFVKYCVTCYDFFVMESHNQPYGGHLPRRWASRDSNSSSDDDQVDLPTYTFYSDNGGVMRFGDWTFLLPARVVKRKENQSKCDLPWTATNRLPYYMHGIAHVPSTKEIFAVFLPIGNSTHALKCPAGMGRCVPVKEVEDEYDPTTVFLKEDGVGTWFLYKQTGSNYLLTVREIIIEFGETATFPTVLYRRGMHTSKYTYNHCNFEQTGEIMPIGRGNRPRKGWLLLDHAIAELNKACNLTPVPGVKLGFISLQLQYLSGVIHLDVTPQDDTFTIPYMQGMQNIVVNFETDNEVNVNLDEWNNEKMETIIQLFCSRNIRRLIVIGTNLEISNGVNLNGTQEFVLQNSNVTVKLSRFKMSYIDASTKKRMRETNARGAKSGALVEQFRLTHHLTSGTYECYMACFLPKICINKMCVDVSNVLDRHHSVWRKPSKAVDDTHFCYTNKGPNSNNGDVVMVDEEHCVDSASYYAFIVRAVLTAHNISASGDDMSGDDFFGTAKTCTDGNCANAVAGEILKRDTYGSKSKMTPTHVIQPGSIWPDFEPNSPGGYMSAAQVSVRFLDLTERCDREQQIPLAAKALSKSDPDGFGRVVEHIYFEKVYGNLCVRITAAHSFLPATLQRTIWEVPLLDDGFRPGDPADVDMPLSSVFTLIEYILIFLEVAMKEKWNLRDLRKEHLYFSLYKDKQGFNYFDVDGGISLKDWPANVRDGRDFVGRWTNQMGSSPFGPLLKRLVSLIPQLRDESTDSMSRGISALYEVAQWTELVKAEFLRGTGMKQSLESWNQIKQDFPRLRQCTTPIDPEYSARRHVSSIKPYVDLKSTTRTTIGRFVVSFDLVDSSGAKLAAIDDVCYEYLIVVRMCRLVDHTTILFEVRYNGVDIVPVVSPEKVTGEECQGKLVSPRPPMPARRSSIASTFFPESGDSRVLASPQMKCADKVRLRLRTTDDMCSEDTQPEHIRAVQWYTKADPLLLHYVGTLDSNYTLSYQRRESMWALTHSGDGTSQEVVESWTVVEPVESVESVETLCDSILDPPEQDRSYSTVYGNSSPGEGYARSQLRSPQAWSAQTNDATPYVIIDLLRVAKVSGIVTRGRGGDKFTQYVEEYGVETRDDDRRDWKPIASSFRCGNSWTKNTFDPVNARYVKVKPTASYGHMSLRVGVIVKQACSIGHYEDGCCSSASQLPANDISDAHQCKERCAHLYRCVGYSLDSGRCAMFSEALMSVCRGHLATKCLLRGRSLIVGASCSKHSQCASNACYHRTAGAHATYACCSSFSTYHGSDVHRFCNGLATQGEGCFASEQCEGDLQCTDWTCGTGDLLTGDLCTFSDQCKSKACHHRTSDSPQRVCCKQAGDLIANAYCQGLATNGERCVKTEQCWSGFMCNDGYRCQRLLDAAEVCRDHSDCKSNACYWRTADTYSNFVCCMTTDAWTNPLGSGHHRYCNHLAKEHDHCKTSKQCPLGMYCSGDWKCAPMLKPGDVCTKHYQCPSGACYYRTADRFAEYVCCSGKNAYTNPSHLGSGHNRYCNHMAKEGETCYTKDQCGFRIIHSQAVRAAGMICSSEWKCEVSRDLAVGQDCIQDEMCSSNACHWNARGAEARLVCCKESDAWTTQHTHKYCDGLAGLGQKCHTSAQCGEGLGCSYALGVCEGCDHECRDGYGRGHGCSFHGERYLWCFKKRGGWKHCACISPRSTLKESGDKCADGPQCKSGTCDWKNKAKNSPKVCCKAPHLRGYHPAAWWYCYGLADSKEECAYNIMCKSKQCVNGRCLRRNTVCLANQYTTDNVEEGCKDCLSGTFTHAGSVPGTATTCDLFQAGDKCTQSKECKTTVCGMKSADPYGDYVCCATDDSYTEHDKGGFCHREVGENEKCLDSLQCQPNMMCNDEEKCARLRQPVEACTKHGQCESGHCHKIVVEEGEVKTVCCASTLGHTNGYCNGLKKNSEVCYRDSECEGENMCKNKRCMVECASRINDECELCEERKRCFSTLSTRVGVCTSENRCQGKLAIGEICEFHAECMYGDCYLRTEDSEQSVCCMKSTGSYCDGFAKEGERCKSAVQCQAGMWCDRIGRCRSLLAAGAPCGYISTPCYNDLCFFRASDDNSYVCCNEDGNDGIYCKGMTQLGEKCATSVQCAPGLYCDRTCTYICGYPASNEIRGQESVSDFLPGSLTRVSLLLGGKYFVDYRGEKFVCGGKSCGRTTELARSTTLSPADTVWYSQHGSADVGHFDCRLVDYSCVHNAPVDDKNMRFVVEDPMTVDNLTADVVVCEKPNPSIHFSCTPRERTRDGLTLLNNGTAVDEDGNTIDVSKDALVFDSDESLVLDRRSEKPTIYVRLRTVANGTKDSCQASCDKASHCIAFDSPIRRGHLSEFWRPNYRNSECHLYGIRNKNEGLLGSDSVQNLYSAILLALDDTTDTNNITKAEAMKEYPILAKPPNSDRNVRLITKKLQRVVEILWPDAFSSPPSLPKPLNNFVRTPPEAIQGVWFDTFDDGHRAWKWSKPVEKFPPRHRIFCAQLTPPKNGRT